MLTLLAVLGGTSPSPATGCRKAAVGSTVVTDIVCTVVVSICTSIATRISTRSRISTYDTTNTVIPLSSAFMPLIVEVRLSGSGR